MIGVPETTAAIGPLSGNALVGPKPASANTPDDLKAAAQQFEAIFIRQMLAAARASEFGGAKLLDGPGLKQFNAMRDEHLAQTASESGAFGFSKLIEAQLTQQTGLTGTGPTRTGPTRTGQAKPAERS